MKIKDIKNRVQKEIQRAKNLKELNLLFQKYLGKRGEISQLLRTLPKIAKIRRAKIGREANELKNFLIEKFEKKKRIFEEEEIKKKKEREWLDVTVPGKKILIGHLHPLTRTEKKVEEIFQSMGFSVIEGPDIETEYYNFDALNIPPEHPARDMWDTFWLKNNANLRMNANAANKKLLLRTHTSPVQIRYMEKNNPPLRIIVPGRCFRHEATDCSHDIQFYQVEGLMVDKEITAANFKAIIQEFFSRFFGKPVEIRLRPSYFPFTEPSFEVDMSCLNCAGKGCPACSKTGWLEMMGAGMVHPAVFKAAGLNPKNWQGFAFGMGLDRLAMMKHKINDIRLFYSGDLRFLGQF